MIEKLIFLAIGILIGGAIGYRAKKEMFFVPGTMDSLSAHANFAVINDEQGKPYLSTKIILKSDPERVLLEDHSYYQFVPDL